MGYVSIISIDSYAPIMSSKLEHLRVRFNVQGFEGVDVIRVC